MRIAVWYNLPSGGAKRCLCDQVRVLKERGHHIEVWRPPVQQVEFADLRPFVTEHEVHLDRILPGSGRYLSRVVNHFRRSQATMRSMEEHSKACAEQIESGGFDLLLAHNCTIYHSPFIGRYVRSIPKVLFLQEPRRTLFESLPVAVPRGWRPRAVLRRLKALFDLAIASREMHAEAENAKAFDLVVVNSFYSRESVLRAYGCDARVCHLGVDISRFPKTDRRRERYVVGLGAIVPTKNVALAVRAVGTIRDDRPPLVWIGNVVDEEYRDDLLALAATLGVDLQLKVLVPDEELADLFARAGAMVYAPRLEPFGMAPLEANASGLGVAAIAEGGLRETITDGVNGRIAQAEPVSLGKAIQEVLADPALGERAERHVREHWTIERSVDKLEQILQEVLVSSKALS